MSKKVIVAGHICIDITPVFPDKKVANLGDLLLPGKLIEMKEADVHTGGCVANTGLAMKILGADVSLMGKVGKDSFGEMVLGILDKYHASEGMIVDEAQSTSYSVVLAVPGIDRIFLHNPGANHTFLEKDIPDKALKEADLLHFGYPPIMRSMFENDGEELVKLLKRAKEAGLATSLDLAAVDADSPAGKADWKKILQNVIPYVDFFVPSIEELCFMIDRPRFEEWQQRAGDGDITEILEIERDIKPLAKQCMSYGAKVLLLKCGAPGMYYCSADEEVLQKIGAKVSLNVSDWAGKEGFEKSYEPELVLSGTGAGDTSIAAFLTAMTEGECLEVAVKLATATGALCVASYDSLGGLKPLAEVKEKIAAGWQKRK